MLKKISGLAAVVLLCAGCYRVTVNTGAPPAESNIDKPWALSFVFGLVPPPVIDAKPTCPNGIATVVTERSFLNGLVGALSSSIVTPLHATVTCAAGPVAK